MPSQTEELQKQKWSEQHLKRLRDSINEFALIAGGLAERIQAATAVLSRHESLNGEFARQAAEKIGTYLLILFCFVGGYGLDCLVFAAPIEFLCGLVNWPGWAQIFAQFAAPLALLAFEALIAHARFTAQEKAEFGSRGAFWFWTVLGLLPAVVAAGFAIATHSVNAEQATLTPGFLTLGIVLGAWSLIVHLVILLTGRNQHEAKAYLVFVTQRWRIRTSLNRFTRERGRIVNALNKAFANYLDGLTVHNNTYRGNQIGAGPFNLAARTQIEILFGPQVFQEKEATNRNTASGASTSSQLSTSGQAAEGAMNEESMTPTRVEAQGSRPNGPEEDYYRTILSRAMRDRDSEVQC